jgi:threonine dehydrogenase-like Zn-dependent dehydrogenase
VNGTTTKLQRTEELKAPGYDVILDSGDVDIANRVKGLTGGLRADAAWDCLGGNDFLRFAMPSTRIGGTVAVFGAPIPEGPNARDTLGEREVVRWP